MKKLIISAAVCALCVFAVAAKPATPKPVKLGVGINVATAIADADKSIVEWQAGDKIKVDGKVCAVQTDKKGNLYVEADKNENGRYSAAYPADCSFFDREDAHMRLVPAQKYKEGGFDKIYMPMYSAGAVDGNITLRNLCGVLRLTVKGDAAINTVKIEDPSGAYLSGYFNLDDAGKLVCREKTAAGVYFIVLDCSNGGRGVELDGKGADFHIVMPARRYADGLKITFTDRSHRSMSYVYGEALEIGTDTVAALPVVEYAPAKDQVFSETFDAFVYGGDRMKGKMFKGFNPAKTDAGINYQFDGTERAVYLSDFDKAGSGYMQEDFKRKLVDCSRMKRAYLENRNILDWPMMFRVQEYQGYVGVGVAENTRGIIETPAFSSLEGICDIEITFDVCVQAKATSPIIATVVNAGVIKEYAIDGIRRMLTTANYPYSGSATENVRIKNGAIPVPKSEEEMKEWHKVRFVVSGATSRTALRLSSEQPTSKYINGFFVDNIEVKLLSSVPREKTLRVMDYNVQNGMWADQQNNYDNFVEWMREQDADVCIFCEAQTIYYDGTNKHCKKGEQYLPYKYKEYTHGVDPHFEPEGWQELAARWGHGYAVIGAHQDNYPVVVTSKYPITLVQKLGGKDVSHGGVHAQVTIGGRRVNFVGFHTWPQAWAKGAKNAGEREKSKAEAGGDRTREYEFRKFMESTILNPEYADEQNWLIMGDMNCATPLDDLLFESGVDNPRYLGQKYMLEHVPAVDLVKTYACPDKRDVVPTSTQGWGRIDLMYGSKPMADRVIKAKSPKEGFTRGTWNKDVRFFNGSSDHLPVIVDFRWE